MVVGRIDTEPIKSIYSHQPQQAACLQYRFSTVRKQTGAIMQMSNGTSFRAEIYMARNIVDRIRRGCPAAVVLKSIVLSQCHLHSQFTLVLASKSIRRTWARRCHPLCIKSPFQRCSANAACTLPYCFSEGAARTDGNTHV